MMTREQTIGLFIALYLLLYLLAVFWERWFFRGGWDLVKNRKVHGLKLKYFVWVFPIAIVGWPVLGLLHLLRWLGFA